MKIEMKNLFNNIKTHKTSLFCLMFSIVWFVSGCVSFSNHNQSLEIMSVGLTILNIIGTVYYVGEEGEETIDNVTSISNYYKSHDRLKSDSEDFTYVA